MLRSFYGYTEHADLGDAIDPNKPEQITRHLVRAWVSYLADIGNSESTQNSRFRALRAYGNWLEAEQYVKVTPLHKMKAPRLPKLIPPEYNKQEVAGMLRLCPPNTWWGARDRAILILVLQSGVRREEVSNLNLYDVNVHQRRILLLGKGNKQRIVHVSDEALGAIFRYMPYRKESERALFQSNARNGNGRLTPHGVYQVVRDLAKRVGVQGPKFGPHRGRHTFALRFLRAGGNIRDLQAILGHADLATTQVYLRAIGSEEAATRHSQLDPFKDWEMGEQR